MINIAITGIFASGKSFVLDCLKQMGYECFSCDEYVHELYSSEEFLHELEMFLPELAGKSKKEIADKIYSDVNLKKSLEGLVHPKVRKGMKGFQEKNKTEEMVFSEVPLLFENNLQNSFDKVICVHCREEIRRQRALDLRGVSLQIYDKINSFQMSQEEKKSKAGFLLDSEKNVIKQINKIINLVRR